MARILVLEESAYLRDWYARELESDGHEVLQAATVAEAIRELACYHPELVVMDITRRTIDRAHDVMIILLRNRDVPLVLNMTKDVGQAGFMPLAARAYFTRSRDLRALREKIWEVLAESPAPVCSAA
jgi:DNA-binding response OmpR family regulator